MGSTEPAPLPLPGDLDTPIYLKTGQADAWPEDPVFFLQTRDGLRLCRNHRFFTSCVPAPSPPSELATQGIFMRMRYPRLPRRLLEVAIGFFHTVWKKHGSEAGLLLTWDATRQRVHLVCPPQTATVSRSYGGVYPIGLHYEIPDLQGRLLLGDIHSHGDESAYASGTDVADEQDRGAGLHIVIGRLGDLETRGTFDTHIDVVTDGTRFKVAPPLVLEPGFRRARAGTPAEWLSSVKVKTHDYGTTGTHASGSIYQGGAYQDGQYRNTYSRVSPSDSYDAGRPDQPPTDRADDPDERP